MVSLHSSPSTRFLRPALCASTALHLSLLGVLLADAAWPFLLLFSRPALSNANQVSLIARSGPASQEHESPEIETVAALTPEEAALHPAQVFGDRVARSVERAADEAQQQSPEEQRKELTKLAGQLENLSSEKSIEEMAGKFSQWLGTKRRAERPADKPVDGEFDFATAQLHDIRRQEDAEAGCVYFAVLVDAAGRWFESRMEPLEGESAYQTMQVIKANPLAEIVYRRIVMGFLDKLIQAGKQAQEAAEQGPSPPDATP
jgi:hypothetical protein